MPRKTAFACGLLSGLLFLNLVLGVPAVSASAPVKAGSDVALIRSACREYAKTPAFPKTAKQVKKWLSATQRTTKAALKPATLASRKNSKWNQFVGGLVMLQANLDSLQKYNQFSDTESWDWAVRYLKSTCTKMLK